MKKYQNAFIVIPIILQIISSCSQSENKEIWHLKEKGELLWVDDRYSDTIIKKAVKQNLETSSLIIAQITWSPDQKKYFNNTKWYKDLAQNHNKRLMIALDWQSKNREGENGKWSFNNAETSKQFAENVLELVNTYKPDYINLGVEANYYALTSGVGFEKFCKVYREVRSSIKKASPDTKVGLSYQLELLYGHHIDWKKDKTLETIDNLLGDLDFIGLSTYPNISDEKLFNSLNYIDSLKARYVKPIGVSETSISSSIYRLADREKYMSVLFSKAQKTDLKFVIWGSTIDDVNNSSWRDNLGLLDKNGTPKSEFQIWKSNNLF